MTLWQEAETFCHFVESIGLVQVPKSHKHKYFAIVAKVGGLRLPQCTGIGTMHNIQFAIVANVGGASGEETCFLVVLVPMEVCRGRA